MTKGKKMVDNVFFAFVFGYVLLRRNAERMSQERLEAGILARETMLRLFCLIKLTIFDLFD